MIGRNFEPGKDMFRPKDEDEKLLEAEVPYLSAIGALLYLAQCTRPDISFAVNLLARHSSAPTHRHWIDVKTIFRYLRGTIDMGLFYPYKEKRNNGKLGLDPKRQNATIHDRWPFQRHWHCHCPRCRCLPPPLHQNDNDVLMDLADVRYLSNPHKGRCQTGYVFTMGSTTISLRSTKQTIVAASSNHAEIIALHEAVRECIWLRSIIRHIRGIYGLKSTTDVPICIYEDNVADLFTKSLPKFTFEKHVKSIGLGKLSKLPRL
ncbi:putative RNA-directed DNA polymerase [Rosa chinensis]|uniref:Putative RNA-directed DNA polymerase n=1 Tax=Rosa chinensis TaxID=74649 RepID=A0A2P6QPT6_ROSCH|nr:putative RNA-directed DNA polymerase [Rosa chinensis]